MKLDRNINPDGHGKYALLKLRNTMRNVNLPGHGYVSSDVLIKALTDAGFIHWGDEGPGEQFFVMKYKDVFTGPALGAYAKAVQTAAVADQSQPLKEYAEEMFRESRTALQQGNRIPD